LSHDVGVGQSEDGRHQAAWVRARTEGYFFYGDRGAMSNRHGDRGSKGRWMRFMLLVHGSDRSVE
jgi:hypothetical protein